MVVPIYNERENLRGLIHHIQALEGYDEVFIIDSSDAEESRAIASDVRLDIEGKSRINYIRSASKGRASQMNAGASLTSGDVLLFLHCDTRLPVNAMRMIGENINTGVKWGRFDVRLGAPGLVYRIIEKMINLRSRLRRIGTGDQAIYVLSQVFHECGGYPPVPLMEDIALSKRLNRYSRPGLIKQAVITSARRWQNRGPLKTVILMWKLRFLFWVGVAPERLAVMYGDER